MRLRRPDKKRFLAFLAVLGPGIITASVDNDAGGIATYSIAGAHFGYSLLWTLIPITAALIVVQEMVARMGVVTGKTLADLILEIFGVSKYISVPIGAVAVWFLVVKGTYRIVEKIFLIASTVYFTYAVSAYFAHPQWGTVARAGVTPVLQADSAYVIMLIGMVGTTIAPWMQFYLQSAIVEKHIPLEDYALCRADVIIGCFVTYIVALSIIVACGATMFAQGIHINDALNDALDQAPLAGKQASLLFAIGLANASLFSASILPLATAYSVCEGMGWESGIDKDFRTGPHFFWLFTGIIVLGALCVLYPAAPLILIMLFSQVANGILLPFVLVFMLKLINDRDLMGEYVNSKAFNEIAGTTAVVMILLTLFLVILAIVPGLPGMLGAEP